MTNIEIYTGSLINQASDRAVLEATVSLLSKLDRSAVILSNINIGGRQIDLVVATGTLVLLIEAKSSHNPLRGGVNGPWEVRVASGGWKPIRNHYLQTLEARHALRDAMAGFAGSEVPYPSAALVFTPKIPDGSLLCPSDFKVSLVAIGQLEMLLGQEGKSDWPSEKWRQFASYLRLVRRPSVAAACDSNLAEAHDLLDRYCEAFRRTYGHTAGQLMHGVCEVDQATTNSNEIIERGAGGASLLFKGPSGCGKTLMAHAVGMAAVDHGRVPLLTSAKDFDGNLRDALDQETVLLDAPSAKALIGACSRLGRPISLIIDGYNESAEHQRTRLTRSMAAAARRYELSLIVTAQQGIALGELLNLEEVLVSPPSDELKTAIATRASGETQPRSVLLSLLESAFRPLLESVSSGLEARLIGEASSSLSPNASRYALFDAYARKKMGRRATEGIRVLSRIAGHFRDRVSFSLSVRDLDRWAENESIDPASIDLLVASNLLAVRGDRVSFAHELFLNAFAAEAVVRRAAGDSAEIARALASPKHRDSKALILGAIDDDSVLAPVLAALSDAELIQHCLTALCGVAARTWAETKCAEVMRRARAEADQITFTIGDEAFLGVRVIEDSLLEWSLQEKAFLAVAGALVSDGSRINKMMDIAAAMDRRLSYEHARLREIAKAANKKIALRSGLFAACYVSPGPSFGVNMLSDAIQNAFFRSGTSALATAVFEWLSRENLSDGQVYLLLRLSGRTHGASPCIAPLLPKLIRRAWRATPYHLKLDILHAAYMSGHAEEADRKAIIEALHEAPSDEHVFISTSVIDALKNLGALEDDVAGHIDVVRAQIRQVLADQENAEMQSLAHGIWYGQFDHPYDMAYYSAISELSDSERKALLVMSGKGAPVEYAQFISILIAQLAEFGDAALGTVISRWLGAPKEQEVFPQDAIKVYMLARIALARLGCPLPDGPVGSSPPERALAAVGEALYWVNRSDLPLQQRRAACAGSIATLLRHHECVAAGVLWDVHHSYLGEALKGLEGVEPIHVLLGEFFPSEVVEISREALLSPEKQRGFFVHVRLDEILSHAVACIGQWGTPADVAFLKPLSANEKLGSGVIQALRKLEQAFIGAVSAA